jgi:hypothetical protein
MILHCNSQMELSRWVRYLLGDSLDRVIDRNGKVEDEVTSTAVNCHGQVSKDQTILGYASLPGTALLSIILIENLLDQNLMVL